MPLAAKEAIGDVEKNDLLGGDETGEESVAWVFRGIGMLVGWEADTQRPSEGEREDGKRKTESKETATTSAGDPRGSRQLARLTRPVPPLSTMHLRGELSRQPRSR